MTTSTFDVDNVRLTYRPSKDPRVYMESRSNGKAVVGSAANGKQRQSNVVRVTVKLN